MTITLTNCKANYSTNCPKKLSTLLKECRLEMHEMKTELNDIQTALKQCRTSLRKIPDLADSNDKISSPVLINMTPTGSTPIKITSPHLSKFKRITPGKKTQSPVSSTPKKFNPIKCENENLTWSSSLNEEDFLETNHTLLEPITDDESSAGYPSRSILKENTTGIQTPKHWKFKKSAQKSRSVKKSLFNSAYNRIIKSTKSSYDLYDAETAVLPTKKSAANNYSQTPISWRNKCTRRILSSNYLNPSNRKKLKSPTQATVRVYKHNSQRLSNLNRIKLLNNQHHQNVEKQRNNLFVSRLEFETSELCEKMYRQEETSLLKFRPVSPIPSSTISSSSCSISFNNNNKNKTNKSFSVCSLFEKTAKNQIMVINHKSGFESSNFNYNTTIFEPNMASTPLLREPKTSTPNLINTSYMDNIITDLVDNNHQININQCLNNKLFVNENAKKLENFDIESPNYSCNYENDKQYNIEDENDNYDIPEPHLFKSDHYQTPNTLFYQLTDNTIEDTKNLLRFSLNNSYSNSQLNINESTKRLDSKSINNSSSKYDSNNNLIKINYNYKSNVNSNNNKFYNKTCSNYCNHNKHSQNDLSRTRPSTSSKKYANSNFIIRSNQKCSMNKNPNYNINNQNHQKVYQSKNLTLISNASSVTSSVIKCCIRPFRNLIFNKNKILKK